MLYSRKKRIAALTFGGLVVLAVLWIGPARIIHAAQSTYNKMMVLTMVLDKIERFYVDDRNPDELIDRAIDKIRHFEFHVAVSLFDDELVIAPHPVR